jgi:hypothetical protein
MSYASMSLRVAATFVFLFVAAVVPTTARQRLTVDLDVSQLSVVNDVADATFKVVIKNDEDYALSAIFLIFDDGFEVSIGDVAAESSGESSSVTRTFDLSQHIRSLNIPLPATLKYSADGQTVEQAMNVVLRLSE